MFLLSLLATLKTQANAKQLNLPRLLFKPLIFSTEDSASSWNFLQRGFEFTNRRQCREDFDVLREVARSAIFPKSLRFARVHFVSVHSLRWKLQRGNCLAGKRRVTSLLNELFTANNKSQTNSLEGHCNRVEIKRDSIGLRKGQFKRRFELRLLASREIPPATGLLTQSDRARGLFEQLN